MKQPRCPLCIRGGDYDLAGFVVGAIDRDRVKGVLPDNKGYTAIGLASSGLHANGFSLVHKIINESGTDVTQAPPFYGGFRLGGEILIDVLMTPTRIYKQEMGVLYERRLFDSACHITGGGFYDNISRCLPDNAKITIDSSVIPEQGIFGWLQDVGNVSSREMYSVFNMGVGMVVFTRAPDNAQYTLSEIGVDSFVLGEVTPRSSMDEPQVFIKRVDDISESPPRPPHSLPFVARG